MSATRRAAGARRCVARVVVACSAIAASVVSAVSVAGFAALLLAVEAHAGVRLHPGDHALDLMISAFAVLRTDLSAENEAFFDSDDELPAVFTNRQLLNVRADGKLFAGVGLDARLNFDRENLRDWRYFLRVHGQRGEVAFGELPGALLDTELTRYDTPFYGLSGRLSLGPVTAEAFTTTRDGTYRVDRLRGNNLSGPFITSASPVIEASERIAIEVRDRLDPEEIVRSDFKRSGLDYVFDYATGAVQFNAPVEAETFDGNPVFVVVEYQYRGRTGSASSSRLGGARVTVRAFEGLDLGSSFIRAGGDGGTTLDDGVIGLDQHLDLRWLRLDNELSGPVDDPLSTRSGAWRFRMALEPRADVQLCVRVRRVGKEFDTLANPTLDSEVDRQSIDVDLAWSLSAVHRLTAGFGRKRDDVGDDPTVVATRTRTWFAGWESKVDRWPLLRTRFERRSSDGPGTFGGGSATLDTVLVEVEDGLGAWPLAGDTNVRVQYRWEVADEQRSAAERRAQYLGVRFESQPMDSLDTFVETRLIWNRGGSGAYSDSQTRELQLGGRLRLQPALEVASSLRWWSSARGGIESAASARTTGTLELRYEPSDRLHARLSWEWTLVESDGAPPSNGVSGIAPSRARNNNIFANVVAVWTTGLTTTVGYRLDDQSQSLGGIDGTSAGEYFASLLYQVGRLTLFGRGERGRSSERLPPFDPTDSVRTTWLGGASWDIDSRWTGLSELRDERLSGAVVARRRAIVLELGRKLHDRVKLATGVEITLHEQGDAESLEREYVYVKLVGTL